MQRLIKKDTANKRDILAAILSNQETADHRATLEDYFLKTADDARSMIDTGAMICEK